MRATLSRRMNRSDIPLRGALLMPLCALAVHQLRFYLAFGSHSPAVLAHEGHGYLQAAEPAAVLLLALCLGWFVGSVAIAAATPPGPRLTPPSRGRRNPPANDGILRTWLICALLLFAIYCGQELFEGFFSPGHPAGIAGILGHGGWIAAPISLLIGAALALALRVAQELLDAAESRGPALWGRAVTVIAGHPEPLTGDWRLDPQAGVVAGRAPPRSLSPSLI